MLPPKNIHQQLDTSYTSGKISRRLEDKAGSNYLKDFVYGAVDGGITTFAIVSGVAGAALAPKIVVIMGLANLIADGFSMAVSNYLGSRTETQLLEKTRAEEETYINIYPEEKKEEIRRIFAQKGFEGDMLERAVQIITSDKTLWVDTLLKEEYDLPASGMIPWKAATATFIAFLLIGFIPVFPFLWNFFSQYQLHNPFLWSSISTGCSFFAVGAIKSKFVSKPWYTSGLETLILGGVAAALAYLVGNFLKGIE